MMVPSLPLGGGGPLYVTIFWVTFVSWELSEFVLNTQQRSKAAKNQDRGSFLVLVLGLGIAFSLDFSSAVMLPGFTIAWRRTGFVAGMLAFLLGSSYVGGL
jgi:hypothetical protein